MAHLISTCRTCRHWQPVPHNPNLSTQYQSGGHCSEVFKLISLDSFEALSEAWVAPTIGCVLYERTPHAAT